MQHPIQSVTLRTGRRAGEQGFMLVAMIVLVALVLIALAVAAPVVARDLRRDKEVESEHRADQYVRALRMYYKKSQTYPGSMEALEKSNNVRYLRKQYVDPLTGKPDWRIIHVGENQTSVKGFFGEPLGGLDTKGIGGGLGSAAGMSSGIGGTSGTPSGTSTIGQTSALGAGFGGATVATPGTAGTPGTPGASGTADSGTGTGIGNSGSTASSGFGSGGVGQIMGVGTSRSGASILTPNQQASYEKWEFLYDPRIELLYAKANILGGGIGSQSAASFGSDATSGQQNSGTGNNGMSNPSSSGFPSSSSPTSSPFGSNNSSSSGSSSGTGYGSSTPH